MIRSFLLFCSLFISIVSFSQENSFSICSWNLKDLGRTKSDEEIEFIAKTIKDYDVVLVQEVVAKDPAGAQAVGRLGEALKRLGAKWEYRISDATSGENSYKRERYAFLWKPSKMKLIGKPWLEKQFHVEINREPYFATFAVGNDTITLVNFHAITKSKQPETEVKYFKFLPEEYPELNLLFCGDFNLPQSHTVFNPLKKMSFSPAFVNQKTSLKKECLGEECLSNEFDNIFYNAKKLKVVSAKAIHFYKNFPSLQDANRLSDHIPIVCSFVFLPKCVFN